MTRNETCDIIVIGGGSAAFEAAVSAREAGAERVVMLEKAPEAEYGGNARYSGTGFRFVHAGADEIRKFVPDVDAALFSTMVIAPYSADDFMSDIDRMTLRFGGKNNAYTSEDYTIYHFDFAADGGDATMRQVLGVEADRMHNLRIDTKHEFEQEKGAVISELEMDEDMPWDIEQKTILPLLFGKRAPYGHPVIGERDHVRAATATVIKSHYDKWYHPNNAALVVCGGFVGNVVLKMLEGVSETIMRIAGYAYKERLIWRAGLMMLSGGISRLKINSPSSSTPRGPRPGLSNASRRCVLVLVVSRAAKICPPMTTITPNPFVSGLAATCTASNRFAGPSQPRSFIVRMAPVKTIGFSLDVERATR